MQSRRLPPEARRELLVAKAASQRVELAMAFRGCEPPLRYASIAYDGVRFVRHNPLLVTAVTALLTRFAFSPLRTAGKWATRFVAVWQLWARVRPFLLGQRPAR